MTGFEQQTFGVGSDRSTNWGTTSAQIFTVSCTKKTTIKKKAVYKMARFWVTFKEKFALFIFRIKSQSYKACSS